MLGVSLGAIIGALVSVTILPSRREIVFLKRELQSIAPPEGQSFPAGVLEALGSFARTFAGVALNVAKLARARPAEPDFQTLRETCGQAAQALRDECPNSEGARLMLRRLVEDLGGVAGSLERSGA